MYKAILFDFDYTLGDSTNGIALSINHALIKLGYPKKNIEEIKPTIGFSLKDTFTLLTGLNNINEAKLFSQYFKEKADLIMVDNTRLYDGVIDSLSLLKGKGYKIGIVTTKYHYRIEQIIKKYDIVNLIDFIAGAEDVKIEKPNPEGLLWAIDNLGLSKKDILYVGDSIVDAQTAQNAGVDFAGVLTGTAKTRDFENYSIQYIGENVKEICRKILKK